MNKLMQRYQETNVEEHGENLDQIEWEKRQSKMAQLKFGADDRRDQKPSDEYDFVFEDQVMFVIIISSNP